MESEALLALIDSTSKVLQGLLKTEVRRGVVYYKSTPLPDAVVESAFRLADGHMGRILLDMDEDTARKLASAYVQQDLDFSDERTISSLGALAGSIGDLTGTRRSGLHLVVEPFTTKKVPGVATLHSRSGIVIPFETSKGRVSIDVEIAEAR